MIEIHPLNDVWVRVDCDEAVARNLSEYFTFESPGAVFMRRQAKYRKWDGRIRLFKHKTHTIYRGLVPRVVEFLEQCNQDVKSFVPLPDPLWKDPDERQDYIDSLGVPLQPTDYQLGAVDALLANERAIILSPTGSGKSLIIYLILRLLNVRTLIVVPTAGLVSQLARDFKSYGYDLGNLHTISAGKAKDDAEADVYISTWQSIYQQPPEYYRQFQCIIVDEVHHAKAKSLTHLLEQAYTTPYRFGFTGTLDDTEANRLILEGLFGAVIRVATTDNLIKQKRLAPLRIKMLTLRYPDTVCKQLHKSQYQDEIDYIVCHQGRLDFVAQLAASLKGNVLVLFNFIEKHGIPLYERLQKITDKNVHYIAGSIDGDERETIRQTVSQEENQILVASYGTFSTGMNVPSLQHIIFASPSRSKIRVIQSIGRGLRVNEGKTHCTLWDIVDDLRVGKHQNFAIKHAQIRAEYYASEKFPVTVKTLSLEAYTMLAKRDG